MRRIQAIPPVALVLLLALGLTPSTAVATSAAGTTSAPQGWAAERVRFEPLDEAASFGIVGGHDYRGAIDIVPHPDTGRVMAINTVSLEDYVRGVSEVPVQWPIEAQKAQAIAARTYVWHQMGRALGTTWRRAGADICASPACQAYVGLAKERRPGAEVWSHAVDATAGQVLLHDGAPILAKYSSSNGGRTVPGGPTYLQPVDDPDDVQSPLHRWRSKLGLGEVAALYQLGGMLTLVRSAGTIVELTERLPDGNVRQHHVAAPEFRARVNSALPALDGLPRRVPSDRFAAWTDTPTGTVFVEGGGYGHGIGMSQYGALGKALRGMPAGDILAAYYGGIRPAAAPPEQLPPQVKVAVADQPDVGITSAGKFRVVDGSGRVIAHVADGQWTVRRAGGGLQVVPPSGQHVPPVIDGFDVEAPLTGGTEPAVVRFHLSAPALIEVTLARPEADDLVFEPTARGAGELTYRLPVEREGSYVMHVHASAGEGREASAPIRFDVGDVPARAVPDLAAWTVPAAPTSVRLMIGLAAAAWLVVFGALGVLRPRLH
jgi:stage II sporulation protein D